MRSRPSGGERGDGRRGCATGSEQGELVAHDTEGSPAAQRAGRRSWLACSIVGLFRAAALTVVAAALLVGCGSPGRGPAAEKGTATRGAVSPLTTTSISSQPTSSGSPASLIAAHWSEGPTLPVAVSEVGVAALGSPFDTIDVVGGYLNGRAHNTVHLEYDVVTGRWSTKAPLPAPLDHVGVVAVDGAIYAFGGYGVSGRPTAGVYRFDLARNAWTTLAPMPDTRAAAIAVVLDGKVHIVGGRDTGGDTGRQDVFDPATGQWSTAAPMPTARDHTAYAVLDGKLHVVAGRPGALTVHEVYDPASNNWSDAAPLPIGRSSFAGAALDGEFVVFGGEDAAETEVYTDTEAYDPKTDRWTALMPLPHGVQGIGAAVVDGRIFVPGGGPAAGPALQSDRLLIFAP